MKFKDFFNYDSIAKDQWRKKFQEAEDSFNVRFDLENDEAVGQRTIKVDQDFWDFTDCSFKCEMRMAGGDWESSSVYFRCQLVKGYAEGLNRDSFFCVIPDKAGGNVHLVKGTKGWVAPDSDKKNKPNERQCWEFLKSYLQKLVRKEIKNVGRRESL